MITTQIMMATVFIVLHLVARCRQVRQLNVVMVRIALVFIGAVHVHTMEV